MFAIKNKKTGLFAKHTGEMIEDGWFYAPYPWKFVKSIENAQQYTTFRHANQVAAMELDYTDKWLIVNVGTGEESEINKSMVRLYI